MRRGITLFLVAAVGLAAASTAATRPAAHRSGRTLESTLGFIRDKVAQQGLISYAVTSHEAATNETWTNQMSAEASNVTVDVPGCAIHNHWHTTMDGKPSADNDLVLALRTVKSAQVISMEDDALRLVKKDGHADWTEKVSPTLYVLYLTRTEGHTTSFDFHDRSLAMRVMEAMNHARQLCGAST